MSLNVSKKLNGTTLEVALDGSLDTLTAPQLEEELGSFDGVTELIFDYENLTYISSAGLRVMVGCFKNMEDKGEMKIIHASDVVKEIFEVTGLSDTLNIE